MAEPTIDTQINAAEAGILLQLIAGCQVQHLQPDALEIVANLQSSNRKLQAIIRQSQPLASAVKPKDEATNGDAPKVEDGEKVLEGV